MIFKNYDKLFFKILNQDLLLNYKYCNYFLIINNMNIKKNIYRNYIDM